MGLLAVSTLLKPLPICADEPPVVPLPAKFNLQEGCFSLEKPIGVIYETATANTLTDEAIGILITAGYRVFHADGRILAGQHLRLRKTDAYDSLLGQEGYQLRITALEIELLVNDSAGFSYGLKTLGQLLQHAKDSCLPAWSITDFSRFKF